MCDCIIPNVSNNGVPCCFNQLLVPFSHAADVRLCCFPPAACLFHSCLPCLVVPKVIAAVSPLYCISVLFSQSWWLCSVPDQCPAVFILTSGCQKCSDSPCVPVQTNSKAALLYAAPLCFFVLLSNSAYIQQITPLTMKTKKNNKKKPPILLTHSVLF